MTSFPRDIGTWDHKLFTLTKTKEHFLLLSLKVQQHLPTSGWSRILARGRGSRLSLHTVLGATPHITPGPPPPPVWGWPGAPPPPWWGPSSPGVWTRGGPASPDRGTPPTARPGHQRRRRLGWWPLVPLTDPLVRPLPPQWSPWGDPPWPAFPWSPALSAVILCTEQPSSQVGRVSIVISAKCREANRESQHIASNSLQ